MYTSMSNLPDFNTYSRRAIRVVFMARLLAGERGATQVTEFDLLEALVVEDQGSKYAEKVCGVPLGEDHSTTVATMFPDVHVRVLTPSDADKIIRHLESRPSKKEAGTSPSAELSFSAIGKGILEIAGNLRTRHHHNQVTPVHLFAACGTQESLGSLFKNIRLSVDELLSNNPV